MVSEFIFDAPASRLTSLALYASESSLIKICYKMGFSSVSCYVPLPDHEDFRDRASRKRQRTMLLAAKSPLHFPGMSRVPEPQDFSDPWQTAVGRLFSLTGRLKRLLGTGREMELTASRNAVMLKDHDIS